MIKTFSLLPGITLRCFPDSRFKHGVLSFQFLRPMRREEASLNALLSAVLLRGCRNYPDLRAITQRLDDLYGASVGTLVRRIGDYQTTGLHCSFVEDRFALPGDSILAPMIDFARQLLLEPVCTQGSFSPEFVESEKQNLIWAIESQLNDKRAYAMDQMLRHMCAGDSFGIPRLGEKEQVAAITATQLYRHYETVLRESPVELFYVGSTQPESVASMLYEVFAPVQRNCIALPPQTGFSGGVPGEHSCQMDVNQAKLCMGFTTPITIRDERFVAMQVLNTLFGSGMTSKLFMNVRERLSLCYAIGTGFHGSKGILTLSAGIDESKVDIVRREILAQLDACRNGDITPQEMNAAKQALCSSLSAIYDSPGAIENYFATAALSGLPLTPEAYLAAVEETTLDQVIAAAKQLQLHTQYLLKGVSQ